MKKPFFIYLISLLLVTGFFSYVVYSRNQAKQGNNNINNNQNINILNRLSYQNPDYGFSFSYPKDWFIQHSIGDLTVADTAQNVHYGEPINTNAKIEDWAGVIFNIYPVQSNFTWDKFFAGFPDVKKWQPVKQWPEAQQITELSGIFPGDPHYFIKNSSNVIEVYGLNVYTDQNYSEKQKIVEEIIDSLTP